jgi:ATP-dependent DNA helicase RecG
MLRRSFHISRADPSFWTPLSVFKPKDETPGKAVGKIVGKEQERFKESSEKTSEKTSEKILRLITENKNITIAELAKTAGVAPRSIERNIQNLQKQGLLRRIGPDKGGHWEVVECPANNP